MRGGHSRSRCLGDSNEALARTAQAERASQRTEVAGLVPWTNAVISLCYERNLMRRSQ